MRYIKFEGGTGFCGCDFIEFEVFEDSVKDSKLDNIADGYARDNGESYLDIEKDYCIYREDFESEEDMKMLIVRRKNGILKIAIVTGQS